ncbi:cytochrome b [Stutzerimonas nosocomialis]|uniref:cytochrome b n=1 Tax=Stutzerimonas nosocomialis TaxID=1056496 RepID=UPI001107B74C|nr:cytochrome b [Stutzerimonas nosocomialis]TLX53672.1 cytochrome b [Stutzerimonas nosocomialis]
MKRASFQLHDTPARYGTASRLFHWGMALILAWQFATALARLLLEDTAIEGFLWATHRTVGLLLILLVIARGLWSLHNRGHRPASLSPMATLGHLALYALMVIVPLLALLRQYGSGRAFEPFGLTLMPGFDGPRIDWLMAPANLLHSWLGWLLLALIVGHVAMVFIHRRRPQDEDVLARMLGDR